MVLEVQKLEVDKVEPSSPGRRSCIGGPKVVLVVVLVVVMVLAVVVL